MKHEDFLVDILDDQGNVVTQKKRKDINKPVDIYRSVHTMLVTPDGKFVLGRIPFRTDLPNIYIDQLGTVVATIQRSGESPEESALRSVSKELYIESPELHKLGEKMYDLDDGRKNYITFFYIVHDIPQAFSKTDVGEMVVFSPQELEAEMAAHGERFAPTLRGLWGDFGGRLG